MLDLPTHPKTGLTALGVLPSGRIVWPVLGGAPEDEDGGGTGDGGQGGDGDGGEQTFTQADVDRIVANRLSRARKEFADYDDLKAKAAKLDEVEAAKKSDLERERERAAAAEKERDEAMSRAQKTLVRSEIAVHAAAAGAVDVADVVALLTGSGDVTVGKDGEVEGAKEAVKAMKKAKPHLFGGAAAGGGGFQQGARRGEGDGGPSVARGRDLYEQSRKKR